MWLAIVLLFWVALLAAGAIFWSTMGAVLVGLALGCLILLAISESDPTKENS